MELNVSALWGTDIHISDKTVEVTSSILGQLIDKSIEFNRCPILLGGDIFNSRKSLSDQVLRTFLTFVKRAADEEIPIIAIPGNHDKTDYFGINSFLDFFDGLGGFVVVREVLSLMIGDTNFVFVPYFDESIYGDYLERAVAEIIPGRKNYLMTHIAIDGVKNNDGTEVKDSVSRTSLKKFDGVFVGHYHNHQEMGNVIYTGSTHSANFGEDNRKGIYLFLEDGSFLFEKLAFPEYHTEKLSSNASLEEIGRIKALVEANPQANYRVKIADDGLTDQRPQKALLEEIGIKVEIEREDMILDIVEELEITKELTFEEIKEDFEAWSNQKLPTNADFGKAILLDEPFYYVHQESGSVWKTYNSPEIEMIDGLVELTSKEQAERFAKEFGIKIEYSE